MSAALVEQVAATVRDSAGVAHKRDIDGVLATLGLPGATIQVGDDCAAIPDGDGFLLLAIEGFMPGFVAADPFFAGYCGVMVNLSDIAAMGGRPIAVVDALWSRDAAHGARLLEGLKAGSSAYGVPVVGGHSNLRSTSEQLAVAVLGRATHLLSGFAAMPGQALMAAIDLRGRYRDPDPYWDASSGQPAGRLRGDLDLLPQLAESGRCRAAKDISMAGLVGTAMMLLESSGLGARIDLDAVPRPPDVPLARWLASFPSYGYLMSVQPDDAAFVARHFTSHGIACAAIGHTDANMKVRVASGSDEALVWDLGRTPLTGCLGSREQAA